MFSRDDFKEGKNRIENKRENGHEWCLVERGEWERNWWAPAIFPPGPPKLSLSNLERK